MTIAEGKALYLKYLGEIGEGADPDGSYALKYGAYIDPAVRFLSASRPIFKTVTVNSEDAAVGAEINGMIPIAAPSDSDRVVSVESGLQPIPWTLHNGGIAVDSQVTFPLTIRYSKRPDVIGADTADSTEFELDIDVQGLIPLLCAAWASANDDPDLSNRLQAQFNNTASVILNTCPSPGNTPQTIYTM